LIRRLSIVHADEASRLEATMNAVKSEEIGVRAEEQTAELIKSLGTSAAHKEVKRDGMTVVDQSQLLSLGPSLVR